MFSIAAWVNIGTPEGNPIAKNLTEGRKQEISGKQFPRWFRLRSTSIRALSVVEGQPTDELFPKTVLFWSQHP
ncbi:MAG: hypothetical protein SFW36_19065 [Leptolyngbyaceae cyanobacterium bins.59]|nr:hypothetical protein [Leptolyngbyaceae cyanobacterium bins.59]